MLFLFILWTLSRVITSLTIPQPRPLPTPKYHYLTQRTKVTTKINTTIPTLKNYTSINLHNKALVHYKTCHTSFLGQDNLPFSSTLNISKCAQSCEDMNEMFLRSGSLMKCRAFNAYLLFRDGEDMGMQCVMYQRKWGEEFATNDGDIDAWGRRRDDADSARYEVRESWSYWLSEDNGDQGCGAPVVVGSGTGVPVKTGGSGIGSLTSGVKSLGASTATATGRMVTGPAALGTVKAKTTTTNSSSTSSLRKSRSMKTSTTKTDKVSATLTSLKM